MLGVFHRLSIELIRISESRYIHVGGKYRTSNTLSVRSGLVPIQRKHPGRAGPRRDHVNNPHHTLDLQLPTPLVSFDYTDLTVVFCGMTEIQVMQQKATTFQGAT